MKEKQEFKCKYIEKRESSEIARSLDPLVKEWFFTRFKDFSLTQRYGVMPIFERRNILVSAPTGGTKTLTAFLSIINHLVSLARRNELEQRVYAVYVSPLKALSSDIYVNLIKPLEEIEELAKKNGIEMQKIHVGLRTGDTEQKERARQARQPPNILVTTPESLAIIINSPKFSLKFELVEFLIVDEIHSLAENKRGVHLSLTLERLQEISKIEFTRIGLSATISPLEKVANFLVGSTRECDIASVELEKQLDLKLKCPVANFLDTNTRDFSEKLYELLNHEIESHKTTLIFTNTRAGTERVVNTLKERFPKTYTETVESEVDLEIPEKKEGKIEKDIEEEYEEDEFLDENEENEISGKKSQFLASHEASDIGKMSKKEKEDEEKRWKTEKSMSNIGAHHSSLSKELRFDIENRLREGKLKVVVCSTSLELGIDVGYIDLVILLSSPKAVSRALQRVGRAGHKLNDNPRGVFIVNDFDDLVECAVILKNGKEKLIDKIHIPENCLDILAQQIFGMAIGKVWKVDEMLKMIKKSYCYRNLSKEDFYSVVSYLSGEYELEKSHIYAKIWYDVEKGEIGKRGKMARVIYMTNVGTIPDESFANVMMQGHRIGQVDEVFLEKLRKGDVFVLGGSKYMYLYAKGMNIYVRSAEGRKPTIPSWASEMLPLSFDSALSIGKLRKLINDKMEHNKSKSDILNFIQEYCYIQRKEAEMIHDYMKAQYDYSLIPHENRILIEEYRERTIKELVEKRDDNGKNYILFHCLFGRRVNDALSRAIAFAAARINQRDVEVGVNDNGFFVAGTDLNLDKLEKAFRQLTPETLREILEETIDKTEVLKRRFRHCASRGLMILRNYKGHIKSVKRQQMSSHFMLAAVQKKGKDFPILKEARREVLEDLMDIQNTQQVLKWIGEGKIKIEKKNTRVVSPFAIGLLLSARSDIIRIEDKIDFIKRVYRELKQGN